MYAYVHLVDERHLLSNVIAHNHGTTFLMSLQKLHLSRRMNDDDFLMALAPPCLVELVIRLPNDGIQEVKRILIPHVSSRH